MILPRLATMAELASATGLTVRTLHYYEEIGLLVASERSDAGTYSIDPSVGPTRPATSVVS